jgi:hypothetical protein
LREIGFVLPIFASAAQQPTRSVKRGIDSGSSGFACSYRNTDDYIESAGDIELCILVLTEPASALRDRNRPDLLPRELLDDLQQVNRKIVKRLSNSSFPERESRRSQVLH